jgi:hypothetical protein
MSDEIDDRIRATFQRRAAAVTAGLDDQPTLLESTRRSRRRRPMLAVAAVLLAAVVGAGIWRVARHDSVRVHSTNPASGVTTTSSPTPTTSGTDPTLPTLAASEVLILPGSGADGVALGDVVHPVEHPQYADGSPATIVDGRVVGGTGSGITRSGQVTKSVLRTCEWMRDTTTVPGFELTLEKSSVGELVVGIRSDHAVTGEGIRAGASLADVERVEGPTTPLPNHTFDGIAQSGVSADVSIAPYVFFLDPTGTKVVSVAVEDGQNSPVNPISCD